MTKTYTLRGHASLACSANTITGVGHPQNLAVVTLRRRGVGNDTYDSVCPCGSTMILSGYAKRKRR